MSAWCTRGKLGCASFGVVKFPQSMLKIWLAASRLWSSNDGILDAPWRWLQGASYLRPNQPNPFYFINTENFVCDINRNEVIEQKPSIIFHGWSVLLLDLTLKFQCFNASKGRKKERKQIKCHFEGKTLNKWLILFILKLQYCVRVCILFKFSVQRFN